MSLQKLYIFVEGNDDLMFFDGVFKPLFLQKYADVEIIQYAQLKKSKVDLFLLSIQTLNFDYFLVSDIDNFDTIGSKKRFIKRKYDMVDNQNIIVVITEIESWFLAGITDKFAESLGLDIIDRTDEITKEDFNKYYIKTYRSRIDFMQELLNHFSIQTACTRNRSFNFFFNKFFPDL